MPEIQALMDRIQRLGQSVDHWNAAMVGALILTAAAALAVLFTTRMVIVRSKQLSEAQGTLLRAKDAQLSLDLKTKDERIADLNRQASDAEREIALANQHAAEATAKAESERLARVKLEHELAPRRLNAEQIHKLAELLKDEPEPIAIVSAVVDGESADFANDFDTAFKAAGWETKRFPTRITVERGLEIGTQGKASGLIAQVMSRVQRAFTAVGIPCRIAEFRADDHSFSAIGFEKNVLYIVVNHKPEIAASATRGTRTN